MKFKLMVAVLLPLALVLFFAGLRLQAQTEPAVQAKLAAHLQTELEAGDSAEFLVILNDSADLSRAAKLTSKADKGAYVYQSLRQTAQASQSSLKAWLDARDISYQPFYIVNALLVEGDQSLALEIAARPDVLRLEANPTIYNALPPDGQSAPRITEAESVEPGILYTNADDVWNLGFTGQGIVVGGQDTGYDWDHPALKNRYRGWNGTSVDHDYNWHDSIHSANYSCPANSIEPCDDHSHGTHTMGTAVGDDGGSNQIGMAPGAEWIGCRNMNAGVGTPATYLECFQFFLAPYPVGGDPEIDGDSAKAPDVTVNSWSCPGTEGCNWDTLQAAVEAQRAAGIMTVVAATNSGQRYDCGSTIIDPPAIYDAAYTVGALDTGTDDLASFSSVGPKMVDGNGHSKPDIVAPGTGTRSSIPGGGYSTKSGTSMATPHVAGAVALLWSAVPTLTNDIPATEAYLNESAVPIITTTCSNIGIPNNYFGHGRLDIYSAVEQALIDYEVPPIAEIKVGDQVTSTQTIEFAGEVRGLRPITFTWSFGDGEVITGTETGAISHTYAATGTYTVILTAENIFGADVISRMVTVKPIYRVYLPLVLKTVNNE